MPTPRPHPSTEVPSGAGPGRVLVLTDRAQAAAGPYGDLLTVLGTVVAGGATDILLREKDLPYDERAALGSRVRRLLDGVPGGRLWVASDLGLATDVGAAGVHLASGDPWPRRSGRWGGLVLGRSCHNDAELQAAAAEGVDYVTVSPVFASRSKPGYGPPLGAAGLARSVRAVPGLPVLALGGVGPKQVGACLAVGAAGVAVMGAVMGAPDPAAIVVALLHQADIAEGPG